MPSPRMATRIFRGTESGTLPPGSIYSAGRRSSGFRCRSSGTRHRRAIPSASRSRGWWNAPVNSRAGRCTWVSRPGLASQLGELTGSTRYRAAPSDRNRALPRYQEYPGPDFDRVRSRPARRPARTSRSRWRRISPLPAPPTRTSAVEADPAVLNLGAFETFFPEHRPYSSWKGTASSSSRSTAVR